jgi:hypothetical protein
MDQFGTKVFASATHCDVLYLRIVDPFKIVRIKLEFLHELEKFNLFRGTSRTSESIA